MSAGSGHSSAPIGTYRPPGTTGLRRDRLLEILLQPSAHIVSVTAAAGSGKTTLLAQVAAARGRRTAWWNAGGLRSTARHITRHLAAAVTSMSPHGPDEVDCVDDLLAIVAEHAESLSIIIDDAHLLAGTDAENVLAQLAGQLPEGIQLILAGRFELPAVMPRARLLRQVVDVTADDLRFRTWEVEVLFRDHYRMRLPPEDAAALTRYTAGWAAGLQMFQLANQTRSASERRRAVAHLLGRSRLLRSYLASTVLAALPENTAQFLIGASALSLMDGTMCDRLLERHGSAVVLGELAEQNIFTARTEDGWHYRFHSVLQTQLEIILQEQRGDQGTREWYGRAARILDEADHPVEAYRAYAHAEDWVAAAELSRRHRERDGLPLRPAGDPGATDADPWVLLADARISRAAGRISSACELYERAEQAFVNPAMRRRSASERAELAPWSGVPGAGTKAGSEWSDHLLAALRGEAEEVLRAAGQRPEPHWRFVSAVSMALLGRLSDALPILRTIAANPDGFLGLCARIATSAIGLLLGRQPEYALEDIAAAARRSGWSWLEDVADVVPALGTADAVGRAAAMQDRCEAGADSWGALIAALCAAVGRAAAGRPTDAALSAAECHADAVQARAITHWIGVLRSGPDAVGTLRAGARGRPHVAVRCFGGFSIRIDHQEIDCRFLRPRALALLRLLAINVGLPVHREVLVEALWPGLTESSGRRNAQVAISAVRGLLDGGGGRPSLIQRRGDSYLLALPDGGDADVVRFRSAVERWRSLRAMRCSDGAATQDVLREVLVAYGGDLLPEAGPAEWVTAARDQHRLEAAEAAGALGELQLATGDFRSAVRSCERAVRIDPFHDAGWRVLIEAHARNGDLGARLRAQRAYADLLGELDVPVSSVPREKFHLGDRSVRPDGGFVAADHA